MSSVTLIHAVAIFSVFAVGLIAGQMLAIGIANYAARGLPETSWTLRFQSENDLLAKTMPPFLKAPAIGLVPLFFLAHNDACWMFAAAAARILIVLAIRWQSMCRSTGRCNPGLQELLRRLGCSRETDGFGFTWFEQLWG